MWVKPHKIKGGKNMENKKIIKKSYRRYKENWTAECNYCTVRKQTIPISLCNACAIKGCVWCK